MLIFTDKTGQLGNQLFEFGTFISNCRSSDTRLINLHFNSYKHYFEGPSENYNSELKLRVSFGHRQADRIARFLTVFISKNRWIRLGEWFKVLYSEGGSVNINLESFKNRIVFKNGSWFTDYPHFYEHQAAIKHYFKPLKEHRNNIAALISDCRKEVDILVGIHIRRGDYKEFLNGVYYFEDSVFYEKMIQIRDLNKDKKIGFLICSNEKVETELFKDVRFFRGTNHLIEDMYSFAECDYILGPPSTYTMWASFYGNKPLLKLRDRQQIIKMEDFEMDYGY